MFIRIPSYIHVCILQLSLYIYLYVGKEFRPSVCLTLFSSSSSSPTFIMLDGWIVAARQRRRHCLVVFL